MKNTVLCIVVLMLFVSCDGGLIKKKYKYVEKVDETEIFGKHTIKYLDTVIISATSDTDAYLQAFEKFALSQIVYNDMLKRGIEPTTLPLSFAIYTNDGTDISDIEFTSKETKQNEILESFEERGHSTQIVENKIDSNKIKSLLPYFNVEKDEFSHQKTMWYKPKSAPNYVNRNGLYLYFMVENDKPSNLRLKFQYYADEWLFIKKIQFSIDEGVYEFYPLEMDRDCGNGGMIWEWCDEKVSSSDKDLIDALSIAKSAKMKIVGKQYNKIKTITPAQITDIKRTLDLYTAMGGKY